MVYKGGQKHGGRSIGMMTFFAQAVAGLTAQVRHHDLIGWLLRCLQQDAEGGLDRPSRCVSFLGRKALVACATLGTLALFLALWETASRTGLVDPSCSPRARSLIVCKFDADDRRRQHLAPCGRHCLGVTGEASGLAVVVGVPIGILVGRSALIKYDRRAVRGPALYALRSPGHLPLILIIWLGIGFAKKVALVFIGSVIIMIINTQDQVPQVDPRLIETARSFTASERQVLTKIDAGRCCPLILASMQEAIGMPW